MDRAAGRMGRGGSKRACFSSLHPTRLVVLGTFRPFAPRKAFAVESSAFSLRLTPVGEGVRSASMSRQCPDALFTRRGGRFERLPATLDKPEYIPIISAPSPDKGPDRTVRLVGEGRCPDARLRRFIGGTGDTSPSRRHATGPERSPAKPCNPRFQARGYQAFVSSRGWKHTAARGGREARRPPHT